MHHFSKQWKNLVKLTANVFLAKTWNKKILLGVIFLVSMDLSMISK